MKPTEKRFLDDFRESALALELKTKAAKSTRADTGNSYSDHNTSKRYPDNHSDNFNDQNRPKYDSTRHILDAYSSNFADNRADDITIEVNRMLGDRQPVEPINFGADHAERISMHDSYQPFSEVTYRQGAGPARRMSRSMDITNYFDEKAEVNMHSMVAKQMSDPTKVTFEEDCAIAEPSLYTEPSKRYPFQRSERIQSDATFPFRMRTRETDDQLNKLYGPTMLTLDKPGSYPPTMIISTDSPGRQFVPFDKDYDSTRARKVSCPDYNNEQTTRKIEISYNEKYPMENNHPQMVYGRTSYPSLTRQTTDSAYFSRGSSPGPDLGTETDKGYFATQMQTYLHSRIDTPDDTENDYPYEGRRYTLSGQSSPDNSRRGSRQFANGRVKSSSLGREQLLPDLTRDTIAKRAFEELGSCPPNKYSETGSFYIYHDEEKLTPDKFSPLPYEKQFLKNEIAKTVEATAGAQKKINDSANFYVNNETTEQPEGLKSLVKHMLKKDAEIGASKNVDSLDNHVGKTLGDKSYRQDTRRSCQEDRKSERLRQLATLTNSLSAQKSATIDISDTNKDSTKARCESTAKPNIPVRLHGAPEKLSKESHVYEKTTVGKDITADFQLHGEKNSEITKIWTKDYSKSTPSSESYEEDQCMDHQKIYLNNDSTQDQYIKDNWHGNPLPSTDKKQPLSTKSDIYERRMANTVLDDKFPEETCNRSAHKKVKTAQNQTERSQTREKMPETITPSKTTGGTSDGQDEEKIPSLNRTTEPKLSEVNKTKSNNQSLTKTPNEINSSKQNSVSERTVATEKSRIPPKNIVKKLAGDDILLPSIDFQSNEEFGEEHGYINIPNPHTENHKNIAAKKLKETFKRTSQIYENEKMINKANPDYTNNNNQSITNNSKTDGLEDDIISTKTTTVNTTNCSLLTPKPDVTKRKPLQTKYAPKITRANAHTYVNIHQAKGIRSRIRSAKKSNGLNKTSPVSTSSSALEKVTSNSSESRRSRLKDFAKQITNLGGKTIRSSSSVCSLESSNDGRSPPTADSLKSPKTLKYFYQDLSGSDSTLSEPATTISASTNMSQLHQSARSTRRRSESCGDMDSIHMDEEETLDIPIFEVPRSDLTIDPRCEEKLNYVTIDHSKTHGNVTKKFTTPLQPKLTAHSRQRSLFSQLPIAGTPKSYRRLAQKKPSDASLNYSIIDPSRTKAYQELQEAMKKRSSSQASTVFKNASGIPDRQEKHARTSSKKATKKQLSRHSTLTKRPSNNSIRSQSTEVYNLEHSDSTIGLATDSASKPQCQTNSDQLNANITELVLKNPDVSQEHQASHYDTGSMQSRLKQPKPGKNGSLKKDKEMQPVQNDDPLQFLFLDPERRSPQQQLEADQLLTEHNTERAEFRRSLPNAEPDTTCDSTAATNTPKRNSSLSKNPKKLMKRVLSKE